MIKGQKQETGNWKLDIEADSYWFRGCFFKGVRQGFRAWKGDEEDITVGKDGILASIHFV